MGLCNLYGYLQNKSIKLSDSYNVQIRLDNSEKEPIELYECTSVTLPTIKMKTDVFQYGNNSKTFIYPDYSNFGELELEFNEHYANENVLCIQKFVDICLHKLFDDVTFAYKLNDYIYELVVNVYSNNFAYLINQHVFHHLKLVDYTKYDLDYSSAEIAKWTMKFMFMEYYVQIPVEATAAEVVAIDETPVVESDSGDLADQEAPTQEPGTTPEGPKKQDSSPQAAYDFINKSKLTGNARKEAALAAGITEADYNAGQKMVNQKYAEEKKKKETPASEPKPAVKESRIEAKPEVQQQINEINDLYKTAPGDIEGKKQAQEVLMDMAAHGELTAEGVQKFNEHKTVLQAAQTIHTDTKTAEALVKMAPGLFR